MNRVILMGRLTRDPEVRYSQGERAMAIARYTLAVDRRGRRNQDGNEQTADFINCVAWRQTADYMANYVKKGALLGVEGRIQTRNYEDQTGKRVYVTEVVCDSVQTLVRSNTEGQSNYQPSYQASAPADNSGYTPDSPTSYDNDFSTETLDIASDDLPF